MTTATIAQLTNITTPALSDIYETEQGAASFQISGQQILELIAANAILKGLAAARPSANVAGRLYYATDTTTLSRDNGVSWDALTTSGVSDGDKGDVTVSGSGAVWTVDALPESRITNLTIDLAGKAATTHTHVESDVTSLIADLAAKQPLDSDLTAIAALSTTAFGRALLALADAAALRTAGGLGTAAVVDTGTSAANVPTITQADARYQPLDSDLTAIAALSTTSYGRSVLALADAAADRVLSGAAPLSATYITQTANSELSAEQALGSLASGYLKNTTTTGVLSVQATPIPQADLGSGSGGAGTKFLADDQTYKTVSGSADGLGLTPTAVKTANYTASAGDLVPCDTSGGAFAVTFPTAPADKTVIAIKLVTAGNTLTLTLGGSDVFNKAGGSASGSLSLANQGIVCQYKATGAIWYVVADDLSLSALDLRYQALDADLTTIAGLTATTDNFMVAVASAWASRTPAQARTSLGLGALALLASVATANIDNDAVTYAKIQNVSATSRILGRTTAGAGDVEELTGAQALTIAGGAAAVARGRFNGNSINYYLTPGMGTANTNSSLNLTANVIAYVPMLIDTQITLDQLACEITTNVAASNLRLGIYNADTDWQPTSLVVDSGVISGATTGVKTASVSTVLAPGRYLAAFLSDAAVGLRAARGTSIQAYLTTLGQNQLASLTASLTYAALPSTGTVWTAVTSSTAGWLQALFLRVNTP